MGTWTSSAALTGSPDNAGLAPALRDSGHVSGNLRRPRPFHRGLLNAVYLSSLSSPKCCLASKAYYARKGAEGKGHKQVLVALARRRLNSSWRRSPMRSISSSAPLACRGSKTMKWAGAGASRAAGPQSGPRSLRASSSRYVM